MQPEAKTYITSDLIAAGHLAIGDGYRAKNAELSLTGIPFARAGDIDKGFHFEDADRFPEEDLRKVGEKISRPGDVVFTSKGTVGRFAFVREDTPRFVFSPQLCYWRSLNSNVIDPKYLYYWMNSREFWVQASAVKGQTDMADYVSLTDQRRMRITLRHIEEQRAITRILGALDDKIDINRQMNHTLEAMAQAIFKSWFVDFDPVTAKADSRQPYGMNAEIAALFPSRFVESELGAVPEGWRADRVEDVAAVTSGKRPGIKSNLRSSSDSIPLYGSGGVMAYVSEPFSDTSVLITGRVGTLGLVFRVTEPCWPSDNTLVLTSKKPIAFEYLYFQLQQIDFDNLNRGSTQPLVTQGDLKIQPIVLPSNEVLQAFSSVVKPMFDRIDANEVESRMLAELRDALLPKLMSGEIRVNQAEKLVEEVA